MINIYKVKVNIEMYDFLWTQIKYVFKLSECNSLGFTVFYYEVHE